MENFERHIRRALSHEQSTAEVPPPSPAVDSEPGKIELSQEVIDQIHEIQKKNESGDEGGAFDTMASSEKPLEYETDAMLKAKLRSLIERFDKLPDNGV